MHFIHQVKVHCKKVSEYRKHNMVVCTSQNTNNYVEILFVGHNHIEHYACDSMTDSSTNIL